MTWLAGDIRSGSSSIAARGSSRIHDILLDRFKLPGGGEAWLPVQGVSESFSLNRKSYADPIMCETYHVVPERPVLNRDLSDRVFSLAWKENGSETDGLLTSRREFDEAARRFRSSLPPRDPDSVKERLDKEVAEADRQSKMLEASSATRSSWSWLTLLPYGFSLGGVGLVGVVAFLKWEAAATWRPPRVCLGFWLVLFIAAGAHCQVGPAREPDTYDCGISALYVLLAARRSADGPARFGDASHLAIVSGTLDEASP